MNIDEARKVLWLNNYRKTLGELLDEGYLNQSRLEWAAQKAYDPMLKQAAQVILESMRHSGSSKFEEKTHKVEVKDVGIETGISLDKARSTLWPLPPYKGQAMGTLVDSKQLSLKDLGYAAEHAWEEKVRQAARTLLLVRLDQIVKEPVPSVGFTHVISGGRSFSQRRESRLIFLEGLFFGLIIGTGVYFGSRSFSHNPNAKRVTDIITQPGGILALGIVLLSVFFLAWLVDFVMDKLTKRLDSQIEKYRIGQEGEDNAVQLISQALDGHWHLFRNISVPGRNKGDLDLVLVGPPGVWVLEVKNFRGAYRNIGETWELRNGNQWKAAKINPSRQANNNALRLKNFLKADNVNTYVNSAIIWANSESMLTVENPVVTVWEYNRLADELGNIWQGEKLAEAERNKIVDKLTKLCEGQKNKR